MELKEIYSKISEHMINGMMLHDQMANYYDFLGLKGYKRCHEYHFMKETCDYRGLCRYYINHYSEFLIGHVIAVFIVYLLYCIILFSYYIFRKNNIKDCIRKTIYITLPPILIMSIYILYSIDYSLID